MDHDYIEKFDVINHYLMGSMTAEESERFEEHVIDCPQCIDCLKTTRDFKQGLRLLTMQQISQERAKGMRRLFLERISWRTLTYASCFLLLAAIVGSILLLTQVRRLRHEADQANDTSSQWQNRYEEQQRTTLSSEQQRQQTEQNLREQVSQLKEELQTEQRHRSDNANELRGWMQPGINVPIIVLNSVRGSTRNPAADVNEIKLPGPPKNFVMIVPLESEAKYKTYYVTILADNRPLWERTGLKPDRDNSLTISFNSRFFRPGDYILRIEGIPRREGSSIIGDYPFRVTKRP